MALLFVGGIMNLLWIAGLAVLVLLEKVVPRGEWVARAAGFVCIAAALSIVGSARSKSPDSPGLSLPVKGSTNR